MKNSEIHNGLPQQELRDFLSMALVKNFELEIETKKTLSPYNKENPFDWAIKDCENEIVFYQNKLQSLKEKVAIIQMIKMNGWEEFDVSDETQKDMNWKLHKNFIGTKSEYDTFISALAKV